MSDDERDPLPPELREELRELAPEVPLDARFWDDFTRGVRVSVAEAQAERRRGRRTWAIALPLVGAAAAVAVWATTVMDDHSPVARPAIPVLVDEGAWGALDAIEELDAADLQAVASELDVVESQGDAYLDIEEDDAYLDIEELDEDELRSVAYELTKGA